MKNEMQWKHWQSFIEFKPNTNIYRKIHVQSSNGTMKHNPNHVRQPIVHSCNHHRLRLHCLVYSIYQKINKTINISLNSIKKFHCCLNIVYVYSTNKTSLTLKPNERFPQKSRRVQLDVRLHRKLIWANSFALVCHDYHRKFPLHHKSIGVSNL